MAKESSYQKLKRKNKELEDELYKLKEAVFMDDVMFLDMIKKTFKLRRDMVEAFWEGEPTSEEKRYDGIYPMMEAAESSGPITTEGLIECFEDMLENLKLMPQNQRWPAYLHMKGFRFRIHEDQTIEMMVGTLLDKEVWTEIDEEQKKHFFNL